MTSRLKKQAIEYELIAMSFHEAGHTVIAVHHLAKVYNVSVMSAKSSNGSTSYITHDISSVDDEILKLILLDYELQICYAGLIAEKIYYKDISGSDYFPMHLKEGSSEDRQLASNLIHKHNIVKAGKNRMLLKKQIQEIVKDIIIEHWDSIKVIAHALYKKRKLNYDEVKFLLTRRTDHKDFWKDRYKKISQLYSPEDLMSDEEIKEILESDCLIIL